MKILVTGATGFLGGWVISRLSAEFGFENVVGTGRNRLRGVELIRGGYNIVIGDLTDRRFVESKFSGITHVIHCAAKSSLWGSYQSFYNSNVIATRNLLSGIPSIQRFIHVSTPSVYFRFSDRLGIKENDELPARFVNHYTATKYIAEQEVLNFPRKEMIRVVLRPRAIIGAGDTVIVPRVIRAFEAGRLRIIGDGRNICDFTSVKNIAQAIYLSLVSEKEINGRIFNITDGNPVAIWQLVKDTLKKLGYNPELKQINYKLVFAIATISELVNRIFNLGEPVLTRYGVGLLKYSQTLDIENARQSLDYEPIITTEESIAEFINYYRVEK